MQESMTTLRTPTNPIPPKKQQQQHCSCLARRGRRPSRRHRGASFSLALDTQLRSDPLLLVQGGHSFSFSLLVVMGSACVFVVFGSVVVVGSGVPSKLAQGFLQQCRLSWHCCKMFQYCRWQVVMEKTPDPRHITT